MLFIITLATSHLSKLLEVSAAVQTGVRVALSQTLRTGSHDVAHTVVVNFPKYNLVHKTLL